MFDKIIGVLICLFVGVRTIKNWGGQIMLKGCVDDDC